ncbi:transcriptional regulator GcvA [Castellaniella denitrificans]|uniref:transcriptional regulator GcvA n=1 Tax=Castellaniella denitrificans TaxID=56119 RepID=UPI001AC13FF5|nr:transcriptional regulator GcvA [Burkholderiales bacterium]
MSAPLQKRQMPPLNHLRAFEVAVRHESFTKAAAELNVTQGAISRHIRSLEGYLGFQLFERVNNNLVIPQASREFARALTESFDGISHATQILRQGKRRTVLTVHSYTNFLIRWLIPKLPDFQAQYPDIEIRLSSGRTEVDFAVDDIDVAIRYGVPPWPGIWSEQLFQVEMVPVCAPGLADAVGLHRPEDLLKTTLYHGYARRDEWQAWWSQVSTAPFTPFREIYPEDQAVMHQCVLAGMGVGLSQRHYVLDDIAAGRLVIPFDVPLLHANGFYVVCLPDRMEVPKIAAFRQWIQDQLRQDEPEASPEENEASFED